MATTTAHTVQILSNRASSLRTCSTACSVLHPQTCRRRGGRPRGTNTGRPAGFATVCKSERGCSRWETQRRWRRPGQAARNEPRGSSDSGAPPAAWVASRNPRADYFPALACHEERRRAAPLCAPSSCSRCRRSHRSCRSSAVSSGDLSSSLLPPPLQPLGRQPEISALAAREHCEKLHTIGKTFFRGSGLEPRAAPAPGLSGEAAVRRRAASGAPGSVLPALPTRADAR